MKLSLLVAVAAAAVFAGPAFAGDASKNDRFDPISDMIARAKAKQPKPWQLRGSSAKDVIQVVHPVSDHKEELQRELMCRGEVRSIDGAEHPSDFISTSFSLDFR
jgi:hypothetical protein